MRTSTVLLLVTWALAVGCIHCTSGRDFPTDAVSELHDGTTRSEAQSLLGTPLEVRQTDSGGEVWIYRHAYPAAEDSGEIRPASVFEAADVIRVDRLVLRFEGETLSNHELTRELAPVDSDHIRYPDVDDYH
jgi:hypothetical protein